MTSECPLCERTEDHAHEFVDILASGYVDELANLRAEIAELSLQLFARKEAPRPETRKDVMTWLDLCKNVATEFGYDIGDIEADVILWNETAFAFAGAPIILRQLREFFTARLERARP